MTTQHTPGPWVAIKNSCYWEIRSSPSDYDYEQVGDACASKFIGGQADNLIAEANARLMAAAPELLEALKTWFEQYASEEYEDCPEVVQTRAAIAKATGAAA